MARTTTTVRKKAQPTRSRRKDVEAAEQQVGQDRPRVLKSTGPASEALEPAHIEVVDDFDQEKVDALIFMEDVLTVMIHESADENDEPTPVVWNGGRSQYFIRGQEQPIKRKFVEVLARAKRTRYTQKKTLDDWGVAQYHQVPHTSLRYPFSVTHDPAGAKGAAWLKKVLAEA